MNLTPVGVTDSGRGITVEDGDAGKGPIGGPCAVPS